MIAGLVVALAISAGAPSAASATQYTVALSPTSAPSGSRATITATITSTSLTPVGSANLTAPDGFNLVSGSIDGPATATRAGSTAQLRNLGLDEIGETRVATLTVDTPCVQTSAQWTASAKESPNFAGTEPLDRGPSMLDGATTGACGLTFSTPPANVQILSRITGVPADPNAAPVAVSVLAANGTPSTTAVTITLALGTSPLQALLNGTKIVTSTGGVATFGDLSVTKPGPYTLTATSPGLASTTSNLFKALNGLASCANNILCTVSAATTGTVPGSNPPIPYTNSISVSAADNPNVAQDGGQLSVAYNVGPDISCANYVGVSPDREVIDGPNREKVVTSVISAALLAAQNRQPHTLRTCLLAPYEFNLGLPVVGGVATNVGDQDGDGSPDYLGVLPTCLEILTLGGLTILIGPPCQVSVTTDSAGNAYVKSRLRADPRDPMMRH